MTLITFPSEMVEFICGPQVKSGTDPRASWVDEVSPGRARYWATQFLQRDYTTTGTPNELKPDDQIYDLTLCLYVAFYRTGDAELLALARQVADRWWESLYFRHGSFSTPGTFQPPPRTSSFAGLMLRALDGRPEMWSWIDKKCRLELDNWVKARLAAPRIYMDLRECAYAQLYGVLLAKVLPDAYDVYENGTNQPPTGRVTDGAARRAAYLADTESATVNYFGRLQHADGGWRQDLWDMSRTDFEQPFMVGLYLESAVKLHELTTKPEVKASLLTQLSRACEHLYRDAYLKDVVPGVTLIPRSTLYFWPRIFLAPDPSDNNRHLTTSYIHAFGYLYKVTGDVKWRDMGSDLWDSCFMGTDGHRALLDSTYYPKEFTMEVRSAPRYLAYTVAAAPAPVLTPVPTPQTRRLSQPSNETKFNTLLEAQAREGYYLSKFLAGNWLEFVKR